MLEEEMGGYSRAVFEDAILSSTEIYRMLWMVRTGDATIEDAIAHMDPSSSPLRLRRPWQGSALNAHTNLWRC